MAEGNIHVREPGPCRSVWEREVAKGDLRLGVRLRKGRERLGGDDCRRRPDEADRDLTSVGSGQCFGRLDGIRLGCQRDTRLEQEGGAGRRELYTSTLALQQFHAELGLHLADGLRQRGLRHFETPRGCRELALLGNRDQIVHLPFSRQHRLVSRAVAPEGHPARTGRKSAEGQSTRGDQMCVEWWHLGVSVRAVPRVRAVERAADKPSLYRPNKDYWTFRSNETRLRRPHAARRC